MCHKQCCCDLLKIHYLCGWNDNCCLCSVKHCLVVICSKFITFVVEMTTELTRRDCSLSCDLLKIHYLCGWNDNSIRGITYSFTVVICSKFITFVVEMTTIDSSHSLRLCCDLLKIHYLCGWNDNTCTCLLYHLIVVICSKFITFVVEMTTGTSDNPTVNGLWFAQNSLPLWLKWQRLRW